MAKCCFGSELGTNRHVSLLAIFGACTSTFVWIAAMKCLAVLLPTLQDQADTYTWVIGWMIVIMEVNADVIGPIASPLERRFGIRVCIMVSGVMIGMAFVIAALSTAVVMAVVLAVMAGPGIGLSNVLFRELIGRCFQSEDISAAYSLSQTSAPIAYMVIPWLSQLFLDTYGYRGTLLLMGAIFFHLTVCGALLRFPSDNGATVIKKGTDYIPLVCDPTEGGTQCKVDPNASRQSSDKENRAEISALRSVWQTLHTEIFHNVSYWFLVIIYVIIQFAYTAWLVYYIPYTQAKGFALSDTVIFTAISGLSSLLTGLSLGLMLNKIKFISNQGFMGITLVLLAVYYLVDPWLTSFWSTAVNQGVYGIAINLAWIMTDVLLCETVAVDQLGSAFGWLTMKSGILRFLLLYLPGLIYDLTKSYTWTFMMLGVAHVAGFAALLLLVWYQRRQ